MIFLQKFSKKYNFIENFSGSRYQGFGNVVVNSGDPPNELLSGALSSLSVVSFNNSFHFILFTATDTP